jgi:hypothetical protein
LFQIAVSNFIALALHNYPKLSEANDPSGRNVPLNKSFLRHWDRPQQVSGPTVCRQAKTLEATIFATLRHHSPAHRADTGFAGAASTGVLTLRRMS